MTVLKKVSFLILAGAVYSCGKSKPEEQRSVADQIARENLGPDKPLDHDSVKAAENLPTIPSTPEPPEPPKPPEEVQAPPLPTNPNDEARIVAAELEYLSSNKPIFIIGGQSNGRETLYQLPDDSTQSRTGAAIHVPRLIDGFAGYAWGGTSVQWWLTENRDPLIKILERLCTNRTHLIWYQGESDSFPNDVSLFIGNKYLYEDRINKFFSIVKETCPEIQISIVVLGPLDANEMNLDFEYIRNIQRNLGYTTIENDKWLPENVDDQHYTNESYQRLKEFISTQIPFPTIASKK